mmetsp:Transcript_15778/g.18044  ORF Transcript_15778/g.18044 Transcript_15778/m.18044 type:complete len:624 (-) Transcript_15778:73-1944(-)
MVGLDEQNQQHQQQQQKQHQQQQQQQQQQQKQQQQQGITTSSFSMEGARSISPQENQPIHSQTVGKTSMAATSMVTLSSLSKVNVCSDIVANIDDDNGAWRKHGQLVRANIVLTDEENEGNSFALSDSCTIERYYHVADRVLEQFLSSNISERNKLIESYLIGNRLFKFLSVVLPTHNQYFSPEPKLTSLRDRSEVQLIELLEYMDELELMIDEMEYNRYILNDLTPSELKFSNRDENNTSITSSDDGDTVRGSKYNKRNDKSSGKSRIIKTGTLTSIATPETPIQRNYGESLQPMEEEDEGSGQMTSSSSSSHQMFQDGNVTGAVQAIEDSHQIQGSPAPTNICESQHKMLKERVAAVLTASNNLDGCNDSLKPIPSASSSVARSTASHSFMDKSKILMTREGETHTLNDTNMSQRKTDEEEGKSFNSWDADFSQFDAFSDNQDSDSAAFDLKRSHIDLLLQDHFSLESKSSERIKPLSKIKEPPISHPRSVLAQVQVNAARLSSPIEWAEITTNKFDAELCRASSDCSSDIFHSLEDPVPFPITTKTEERMKRTCPVPSPITTKIEERMKRAALTRRQRKSCSNPDVAFDLIDHEGSSLVEAQSNRNLLNQFRGCVKSLLD